MCLMICVYLTSSQGDQACTRLKEGSVERIMETVHSQEALKRLAGDISGRQSLVWDGVME